MGIFSVTKGMVTQCYITVVYFKWEINLETLIHCCSRNGSSQPNAKLNRGEIQGFRSSRETGKLALGLAGSQTAEVKLDSSCHLYSLPLAVPVASWHVTTVIAACLKYFEALI